MKTYFIIGIRLSTRQHNAMELQTILTKFGCNIKTRLGLHDASETHCASDGLIILQACGDDETIKDMLHQLHEIDGIRAQVMDLN
ncbi:MAG: hypothetical protein ACK5KR_01105 [Breznakia sp.]